jgi:DNA-binding HxlR family transcriptional regulator
VSHTQVEYALTDMGRSLTLPLMTMIDWAGEHHTAIVQSRTDFDTQQLS